MFVPAFLLHFDEEADYSSDVDESTVEFKIIKASPPTKKTEPKPSVEKTWIIVQISMKKWTNQFYKLQPQKRSKMRNRGPFLLVPPWTKLDFFSIWWQAECVLQKYEHFIQPGQKGLMLWKINHILIKVVCSFTSCLLIFDNVVQM